jgi:hypothetical protein
VKGGSAPSSHFFVTVDLEVDVDFGPWTLDLGPRTLNLESCDLEP